MKTEPIEISMHKFSDDAKLFTSIIEQGIDSRLEAFTQSDFTFVYPRLTLIFHPNESSILMRRLSEIDTENADQWENAILDIYYGIEII